jgi:hypothetical protein
MIVKDALGTCFTHIAWLYCMRRDIPQIIRKVEGIMKAIVLIIFVIFSLFIPAFQCAGEPIKPPVYVGSAACKNCHPKEYRSFNAHAKKSKSFKSIERLSAELSQEEIKKCYSCHTTGYGRPGGFVSIEKTPHLKDGGCEVCHGPGSLHVKTKDPGDIKGHMTLEECGECHVSERINAFRFKPLIHGGAH